tara:strand:- start:6853 stop:8640 length:1788 start_codon:yes stop_codon:yes gene_type:complete
MNIYIVKSIPKDNPVYYNDYGFQKQVVHSKSRHINVRQFIHERQQEILDDFEKWHQALTTTALKSFGEEWWLLNESRIIAFYPQILDPMIYSVALTRLCSEKNIEQIFIINITNDVAVYLSELGHNLIDQDGILDIQNREQELCLKKNRNIIRNFILIFRHLAAVIRVKIKCLGQKKYNYLSHSPEQDLDLVFSQVSFNSNSNDLRDHYFGKITRNFILGKDNPILWILRSGGASKKAIFNHIKKLECEGHLGVILENELSIIDLITSAFKGLSFVTKVKNQIHSFPPLDILGVSSKHFVKIFFSFEPNLDGFLTLSYTKRLFKEINIRRIIYPYEEKIQERAILINSEKMNTKKIISIGYQHASTNRAHSYLNYRNSESQSPKPNKIYTTGEPQRDVLCSHWNWPEEKVDILGSFRFHNIKNYIRDRDARQKNLRLLLIIGNGHELINFEKLIQNNYEVFENCELMIRPYPYSWVDQQKVALLKITKDFPELKVSQQSFEEAVEWSDYTLSCSTSSGIESILLGRINTYICLNNYIIQDPYIDKFDENFIFRINSVDDLQGFINFSKQLSLEKYNMVLKSQIDNAKKIYSDPLK